METGYKSILFGRTLALFGNKIITKDEFWRVSFIIERLPQPDTVALKKRKQTDLNKEFDIKKHLHQSSSDGLFVSKSTMAGISWEDRLCEIFDQHLLETS